MANNAEPRHLPGAGEFPSEVQEVIAAVLPSEDPLDKAQFDPIEFINRNFPDEESLGEVEPFIARLGGKIKELEVELSLSVQDQSRAGTRATQDLDEAKQTIKLLFGKIRDIRMKAEQSEVMVQEICRDIKQLDYAKRHLQTTIGTLKRLNMLVTAVGQLKGTVESRQYREAATLLDAVKHLFEHFESYISVPKIIELRETIAKTKAELISQIFGDFKVVGTLGSEKMEDMETVKDPMVSPSILLGACCAVDALGEETRDQLLKAFAADQLAPYVKAFGKGGEYYGLEQTELRYVWYRRVLRGFDEKYAGIFPEEWKAEHRLTIQFCERTRSQLLIILGAQEPEHIDVRTLLAALQRTLAFEKEMASRFEAGEGERGAIDNDGDETSSQSSKRGSLPTKGRMDPSGQGDKFPSFLGFISGCYDPYMMSYIQAERKNMDDMMTQVMKEEKVDRDGSLPVFSSSVNMFTYIKNSIRRCTALTRGQTFFSLYNEFRATLKAYNGILTGKLPRPTTVSGFGEAYRLADKQEEDVCFVTNTAEYCAETIPQLADTIRNKIDPAYQDAIDLTPDVDSFHDVAAAAVKCLVSGLELKLEPSLTAMQKLNVATCDNVGDQSSFMLQIGEVVEGFVPAVRSMLSELYFRSFCDKFAASFIPRFLSNIFKYKKMNEMGCQQLLLDTYALKTLLLQLPVLGQDHPGQVPASYTRLVTKETAKVEAALKLISTPTEMLVQSFKLMWPDGDGGDLQKIMAVKGLKRTEQQQLLEALGIQSKSSGPGGYQRQIEDMETKMSDIQSSFKDKMQFLKSANLGASVSQFRLG